MPSAAENGTSASPEPKKLILCFDGTGNTFSGSDADTNVVKLLRKLDRNHPDQFHYYQTGIGTYDINESSVNKSFIGGVRSSISKTIDEGYGTTFDAHVMAGYRFLMRYYETGAKIYMFGFSRGAFTAKFLARMIHTVGLLCKGNEEMVPFAYILYQKYLAGKIKRREQDQKNKSDAQQQAQRHPESACAHHEETVSLLSDAERQATCESPRTSKRKMDSEWDEIEAFSRTFCRKNPDAKDKNIQVYFLGIWDCVASVAVLESQAPIPLSVVGTAKYIRHAVAVDERRVKFKAALLAQDIKDPTNNDNIKEVWFPGSHCDVGGGWAADNHIEHPNEPVLDAEGKDISEKERGLWARLKYWWSGSVHRKHSDRLQMSDTPLAWMINELELVAKIDKSAAVKWRNKTIESWKTYYKDHVEESRNAFIHDPLKFSTGTGFFQVLLWKFMEFLPFITRWEFAPDTTKEYVWKNVRFPLNKGDARDIPLNAELHESLLYRLQNKNHDYRPKNNHGLALSPCLLSPDSLPQLDKTADPRKHTTYNFTEKHVEDVNSLIKIKQV